MSCKILIIVDNVYKGLRFIVCLRIVTLILIATFRPHTAGLHQAGHYPLRDELKFIDRDPHWYSHRVKEAIHVGLHLSNINRDRGIEIPKAWMPTIRQHDNRPLPQRTAEGSVLNSHNANNALDQNSPTMSEVCDKPITNKYGGTKSSTQ